MLQASLSFDTILKGFRTFIAKNLGFVGQRAAKLLAVKVGDLKKKSAEVSSSAFGVSLSPPRFDSFSKFDGW